MKRRASARSRLIITAVVVALLAAGCASSRAHPSSAAALSAARSSTRLQAADAKVLVDQVARREVRLKAPGAYLASSVITADGRSWFVVASANGPDALDGPASASPYPNGTVRIYRWADGGWAEQGSVQGWIGPIGGCCGIYAESLTGSHEPDFALMSGGAGDTSWLAVVSDTGGGWHLVPFNYGYSDTTVVNGAPSHGGVATEVDFCGCATGPTSVLFETYQDGAFQPARPPGRSPRCSLTALTLAADSKRGTHAEFSKFACADGWAMAIGTRASATGRLVGLFEANGRTWRPVNVGNGAGLGSYPAMYDIPLTLLRQLTARFGAATRPAVATAPLVSEQAMDELPYVDGVITADGTDWYVAETPTGTSDNPGADAAVYRWSGSAWVKQDEVDQVPLSLNYFQEASGAWFKAVTVAGSTDPGFTLPSAPSKVSAVLTDAGGTWHSESYNPTA